MESPPPGAQPARLQPPTARDVSWLEFLFLCLVLAGGFWFLRDAPSWGRSAYIGNAQYGDAEFWWNGALHFSQGIVAENPNLTYRMGYAAFGGLVAAVVGPDYLVFHQILVAIFLVVASSLYLSLRLFAGRFAAAVAIVFFVFSPYTAEWLAISTSDGLGLILNLVALLALAAGVRDGLRPAPLVLFGLCLSCASLTRPLMTPFIVPAALAVVVVGGRAWRRTLLTLVLMAAAFLLPTVAWMGFMGVTTGNFALTGAAQDSSAFYAASDPQIQTWRAEMYTTVNESAQRRHHTAAPTPRQLNDEFWILTRENYVQHWEYHAERLWLNLRDLAGFTRARATITPPATERWPRLCIWALTLGLGIFALRQGRQWPALAIFTLGSIWALNAAALSWLVLLGVGAGLVSLFFRRPVPFVWAAYWSVGVLALYLTGGTWGPPATGVHGLNGLGYRLGFQFLFTNDLLVACLLGALAAQTRIVPEAFADDLALLLRPSVRAASLLRRGFLVFLGLLGALLAVGLAIVTWRLVARSSTQPVPYPAAASLVSTAAARGAVQPGGIAELRLALNAQDGRPLLATAMTSGFIWNLTGQERSMLLLYQQDNIRPVSLSPRHLFVEIPRHLPESAWMNRQGAWVLRSFRDNAVPTNLPYYFESPAVQAFIPLAADGQSYDLPRAEIFPLTKVATQLAAEGSFTATGAEPLWVQNSGWHQYPRRFGLRPAAANAPVGWEIDVSRAQGKRSFRFGVQIESGEDVHSARHARLETADGNVLWTAELTATMAPVAVAPVLPADTRGLRFVVPDLRAGDSIWFYELVLQADDFAQ